MTRAEEIAGLLAESILREQEHKEAKARIERETADLLQQRTIEALIDMAQKRSGK